MPRVVSATSRAKVIPALVIWMSRSQNSSDTNRFTLLPMWAIGPQARGGGKSHLRRVRATPQLGDARVGFG